MIHSTGSRRERASTGLVWLRPLWAVGARLATTSFDEEEETSREGADGGCSRAGGLAREWARGVSWTLENTQSRTVTTSRSRSSSSRSGRREGAGRYQR